MNSVADLEGAEPAPPPPYRQRIDAVTAVLKPLPVYLFKHIKHGTQNIQSDCHQWLSDSFRVHEIRSQLGLRPVPY